MTQYQYKVERFIGDGQSREEDLVQLSGYLTRMSAEGWRAVSVVPIATLPIFLVTFERPIL